MYQFFLICYFIDSHIERINKELQEVRTTGGGGGGGGTAGLGGFIMAVICSTNYRVLK